MKADPLLSQQTVILAPSVKLLLASWAMALLVVLEGLGEALAVEDMATRCFRIRLLFRAINLIISKL